MRTITVVGHQRVMMIACRPMQEADQSVNRRRAFRPGTKGCASALGAAKASPEERGCFSAGETAVVARLERRDSG